MKIGQPSMLFAALMASLGCQDETVGIEVDGAAGAPTGSCVAADTPEAHGCSTDEDCVHPQYPRGLASEADCYCPVCPGDFGSAEPLTVWRHACFEEQWHAHCSDWIRSNPCLPLPCIPLEVPACASGRCVR